MGKFGMAFCLFAAATCRQTKVRAFGILPSFTTRTASSSTWNKALFSTATPEKESEKKLVPVTLLSGFLGSGKTTALKNLLENGEGVKIGVIVNDVAAVNIDAKLISNPGNNGDGSKAPDNVMAELGGTVELQNGCACCSLSDELLTSMESLMDGRDFDAVVVELSGVADPVAVKQNWEQAKMVRRQFGISGVLFFLFGPLTLNGYNDFYLFLSHTHTLSFDIENVISKTVYFVPPLVTHLDFVMHACIRPHSFFQLIDATQSNNIS